MLLLWEAFRTQCEEISSCKFVSRSCQSVSERLSDGRHLHYYGCISAARPFPGWPANNESLNISKCHSHQFRFIGYVAKSACAL